MSKLNLIATATFGLEAVVKREVEALGYTVIASEDGKITYIGDERAVVRSNIWLRSADRVYIKLAEFQAKTFEDLFQNAAGIAWEEWIPQDGKFTVVGTAVKSDLHSVPDCQAIIKKAIVKRLQQTYDIEWFEETGSLYTIRFSLLKDRVMILLDTSGTGLHKRGYRTHDVTAPIKETLAAAMISLSFFRLGRLMVDPLCGSGTLAIEAAMIGRNIAPGLSRKFAAEKWDAIPNEFWQQEKELASSQINKEADVKIIAADIDKFAIDAARANAMNAGVDDCIEFRIVPIKNLLADEEYGMIITNPPYGERIGDQKDLDNIYRFLTGFYETNPTWSLFFITADKTFETKFGRPANRRRKLYNGRIETCYYQYHGQRPPKKD